VSSPTDRERITAILELCNQGYDKQVVISQDVFLKKHLTRYGGQGYAFILKYIVPALEYAGVSDKHIRNMLVENPKRLLSF
jgi:phosphotriesterase-related protein